MNNDARSERLERVWADAYVAELRRQYDAKIQRRQAQAAARRFAKDAVSAAIISEAR